MADTEPTAERFKTFRAESVPDALAEASRLSQISSEDSPHDSKYAAARVLEECGRNAAAFREVAPKGEVQIVACVLVAARGLVLAETEKEAEGEESMRKALAALDRQPQRFAALLQQVMTPDCCRLD